jgi:hypothetical protein
MENTMLRQLIITLVVFATPAVATSPTDVLECSLHQYGDRDKTATYRVYYYNAVPYSTFFEESIEGWLLPHVTVCSELPALRCIMDQRWIDGSFETTQVPTYGIPVSVTTYTNETEYDTTDHWDIIECEWK